MGHSGISTGLNKVCKVNIKFIGFAASVVAKVLDFVNGESGKVCRVSNLTPTFKVIREGFDVCGNREKRFGHGWWWGVINASCRFPFWGSGFENNLFIVSGLRRGNSGNQGNRLVNNHGLIKFLRGGVPSIVSITTEFFTKRAGEIVGEMPFAQKACQDAVNAFGWTMAIKICVEVSSWAFACMIAGSMVAAAKRTNNDISGEVTFFDQMTKFVASKILADERERVKNLGDTRGTKHEHRVLSNLRKTGTIFIKEGEKNGRTGLISLKGGSEPLGLGNNTEVTESFIEFKFSCESLGGGAVSLSVINDQDKANADVGVATLR